MCLDTKTNYHRKDCGYGWKVFNIHRFGLSTERKGIFPWVIGEHTQRKSYPTNKWLRSRQRTIRTSIGDGTYSTGFHIFSNYPSPFGSNSRMRILRVKYKNVICSGKQSGENVIVAKYMMILPRNRRK
jgi:hypothetical protein